MSNKVTVRVAKPDEIVWINARYDLIGFKQSNYDNEFIAIAEMNGHKVGVGRLQEVEVSIAELGGIFVHDEYRGLGLASKIVEFLVANSKAYSTVFCLPFEHLSGFYKKYGFKEVGLEYAVPAQVYKKHSWCNQAYDSRVLLLV